MNSIKDGITLRGAAHGPFSYAFNLALAAGGEVEWLATHDKCVLFN